MKKIKILITTAILGLLFFTGCDNGFEEVNTNPNDALAVPSELLIVDIARNAGNIMYSSFVGMDMGNCWAQQMAKVNYEEEARFQVRNSVIEGTVWQGLYEDVVADAKSMETIAIAEGNDYTRGAALVLQAYGYHVLTDIFGMIPFTEAMDASNFQPVYDSQEVVYAGILNMLDTANLLLSAGTGDIPAAADIVYGGDKDGWLKFANSLKFRCLMRVSGTSLHDAAALQDLVSNREMFESNADNGNLVYLGADPNANPIYETISYRTRLEYKVNEVLVQMLQNFNDPRLAVYAAENSDGDYRGKPSGINGVPNDDWNYDNVSGIGEFYLEPTLPATFMSYSELNFLMAEAVVKGFINGDDEAYYYEGIKAAFDVNELSLEYADYITQTGVVYTPTNSLKQIAEQNWIAMFDQGIESWTEWRRTGYPVLALPIDAVVGSIPSRYNYPPIESSVNGTNYNAAVAAQGPDLLTTDIWWMK